MKCPTWDQKIALQEAVQGPEVMDLIDAAAEAQERIPLGELEAYAEEVR